ncbi:hypothetical protein quinque_002380 [Culex quinquefasciatus]
MRKCRQLRSDAGQQQDAGRAEFVQIETHGGEGIDPNLDDTFQIVLKKILKKDPTTKTKVLQEFTELIGKYELSNTSE